MSCGGWKKWGRHGHHGDDEDELKLGDKGYMALILDVLNSNPGNGYDVVKTLEEILGDQVSASPGSIYPVLQLLEDAGYVKVDSTGERKAYVVTDEGRKYLAERSEPLASFWARVDRGRYRQQVWQAIGDLKSLAWEVRSTASERRFGPEQLASIREAIEKARKVIEENLAA
jgi:DNA-binding PadR family transcriptional regulator